MPAQNFPRTSHGRGGSAAPSGTTISCSIAVATAIGLQATLGDDDWAVRSTAAGVQVANRLESGATLTDWLVNDSTADHVSLDTSVRPSGSAGSIKFEVRATDGAASGSICVPLGPYTDGDVVWWSYRVWADEVACYQQWPTSSGETGTKLAILSRDANGAAPIGSNQVNEVVSQVNYNANHISGYWQDGVSSSVIPDDGAVTACSSSDFRWQPKVDNGANPLTGNDPDTGAAWSACAQDRARYGGLYSAKSLAMFRPGLGDPLSGGVRQVPREWMTVTCRLEIGTFGTASSRWTQWVARDGQPYRMTHDERDITLGDGPDYAGLTLLPYTTNRIAGGRKVGGRTSNITGVEILTVGNGTPVGDGTLEYNAATGRFRWLGNGESYGTARGYSAANGILTINVASGGDANSFQVLRVTPASLPSSGTTTDTVTIADGRPQGQVNYADVIVSTQPINAPGGYAPTGVSALADLAASLSAGSWGQLTVANQSAILGVGVTNGSMLPQTADGNWCPQTRTIELVAQDHNGSGGGWGMRHAKYDEANNSFATVEAQSAVYGTFAQHSYDHVTINPHTGDLYARSGNAGGAQDIIVFKKPLSDRSVWQTTVPNGPEQWYSQIAVGTCWWSGSFTGAGAHGCLLVFNSGASAPPPGSANDGIIAAYDPLANSWFWSQDGRAPFFGAVSTGTKHSIMEYSSVKNVAVYGGGDANPRKLWRLNADRTVTVMPDVPAGKTVGVGVGSNAGKLVADPVSGNFLLLCSGELWELNPTGAGSWTQKTSPPAGVGDPDSAQWIAATSLPDHGCVAFIRQDTATSGAFWLYKNA